MLRVRALGLVAAVASVLHLASCGKPEPTPEEGKPADAPKAEQPELSEEEQAKIAAAHRVVFADRTSHGYLLLTEGPIKPKLPSRDELAGLVKSTFPDHEANEEVRLLLELIEMEPTEGAPVPTEADDPGSLTPRSDPKSDLIGLHIDVLKLEEDLVPKLAFEDDILVRELEPAERLSLESRGWAILLRADYRNQHAVRGLRLLQTLVRILARDREALIYDPDTLETRGPAAFERRRLQGSLGNVADQIAVVPFPDKRHDGKLRLSTRGMRRFGSVDLELDGLEKDEWALQRGTDLILGLAMVMVREGEFDPSGFAIELDDTVPVRWRDASLAYAGRPGQLPRCDDCDEQILVHLVEREPEPQDPREHVVARIVAPRSKSDAPDYDHLAWVQGAIRRLFGDPASG